MDVESVVLLQFGVLWLEHLAGQFHWSRNYKLVEGSPTELHYELISESASIIEGVDIGSLLEYNMLKVVRLYLADLFIDSYHETMFNMFFYFRI